MSGPLPTGATTGGGADASPIDTRPRSYGTIETSDTITRASEATFRTRVTTPTYRRPRQATSTASTMIASQPAWWMVGPIPVGRRSRAA